MNNRLEQNTPICHPLQADLLISVLLRTVQLDALRAEKSTDLCMTTHTHVLFTYYSVKSTSTGMR